MNMGRCLDLTASTCIGDHSMRSAFVTVDADSQRCGIRYSLINASRLTYIADPIQNAGRNF